MVAKNIRSLAVIHGKVVVDNNFARLGTTSVWVLACGRHQ
jgi:hypothetical protein